MTMRSILFFTALTVLAAPATAQPADLAQVSSHLQAVASMTANFAQTDRSGKTLNGTLSLKRPGKIRFQYQKNVPILVVADGRALTFVDYSVKQVQSWPIRNSPLGVLLDPAKDLSQIARVVESPDPRVLVVEARDRKRPEYGTISLAFVRDTDAPGGLMLNGWVALDAQGNRTSVRLTNQRFNVPMSDETFRWRDPRPNMKGR